MITYQSRWLKYVDLWFDESHPLDGFDVVFRFGADSPVPGATNEEFHTLVVDLTQSEEQLLSRIHRNTRSKIKRAEERDHLSLDVMGSPTPEEIDEFVDFYDAFARGKSITPLSRSHLESQRRAGVLVLSRVRDSVQTLVWHSYLRIGLRALLCNSASLYRGRDREFQNLVGRANRWHHLKDMLHFKESGCTSYDFGGWYAGREDQTRLMINRFKEEFGGTRALQYNAILNRTWRAKILKSFRKIIVN